MTIDSKALAALIAAVPQQVDVFFADMAAVQQQAAVATTPEVVAEKSPRELAIDGVAYHVFNTLRGTHDNVPTRFEQQVIDDQPVDVPVEWATFEDVRALVAEAF